MVKPSPVGYRNGTIRLWDGITGEPEAVLEGGGRAGRVNTVAFAPDGQTLATGRQQTIDLWDVNSGHPRATLHDMRVHTSWVNSVAFSPDGRTLASVGSNHVIALWEIDSGQRKAKFKERGADFTSVAFSPDGETLASAGRDNKVRLWDVRFGLEEGAFLDHGHGDRVSSVAFAPDGTTVASSSWDRTLRLWDLGTGHAEATIKAPWGPVSSVAFAPDGQTLASGWGHRVALWDIAGLRKATGGTSNVVSWTPSMTRFLKGHRNGVLCVAYARDGATLASGDEDGKVRLWDVSSEQARASLGEHGERVLSVAFSPTDQMLASASGDKTARVWDAGNGQLKATLRHTGWVTSVAFSQDERTLASGGWDQKIRLWELSSGQQEGTMEVDGGWINAVAFSPRGNVLASGGSDQTIRLWEVSTGQPGAIFKGHMGSVLSVVFSPDGNILASASADGTILLWDTSPYATPPAPTAIRFAAPLPTRTALLANFPNPFNPDTWIPFQLHAPAHVRLNIYDVRGALVREIDLGHRAASRYLTRASAAHWDGRNHRGERVSSGVYLYSLQAGPATHVRKMVLTR